MNVVVISVDALPGMGGISTMAHHLSNAFSDLGHQTAFMGPVGCHVPADFQRHYHLIEDWESKVKNRSGDLGYVEDARIRQLVGRAIERYAADRVLLLHPFYYGIGALDAARDAKIGCSVYFHGFELRSQLKNEYPANHRALVDDRQIHTMRERVFYLIGASDEILVNSRYTGALFGGFTVRPRVRVTGCGIPDQVFQREMDVTPRYDRSKKRALRAAAGLPGPVLMSYVGRLVKTKRVDRLLSLCSQHPELAALIIGDGPERENLDKQARSLGVAERVVFAGGVSEERKWELLRASDFNCLLSEPDEKEGNVEGFGIVLLEGAAAGAIPVSSGAGGMVDVVTHDRTGLILPEGNDAEAAQMLVDAWSQPSRMIELSNRAREQLRARYTWSRVAERILDEWSPST